MSGNLRRVAQSIIIAVFVCSSLAGCTRTTQVIYPQDTVVILNGKAISEQDLKDETIKREISTKILQKITQLDSSAQTPTAGVLSLLGMSESQLSDDQKRYIISMEREYPDKPISQNVIFNRIVREEVLHQEAVRQGYIVSKEQAQKIITQMNEASDQANLSDPTGQKIM
ncbi:MAG: hypothetical protein PHZ03_06645, partial [Syntrophomonas sp.]|nr:hypothetical protein [Syntrophomonas sp.]